MNDQELQNLLLNAERAKGLTQYGIEQFKDGNLDNALSAFEKANDINPMTITNSLYSALCLWTVICDNDFSQLLAITDPDIQGQLKDITSKLENVTNQLRLVTFK